MRELCRDAKGNLGHWKETHSNWGTLKKKDIEEDAEDKQLPKQLAGICKAPEGVQCAHPGAGQCMCVLETGEACFHMMEKEVFPAVLQSHVLQQKKPEGTGLDHQGRQKPV